MPQIPLIKAEYLIVLSFLLTFSVISNAFYIKKQFYPSVIYLTKSSTSLAVLYAQALVFVILFWKLVQRIFLGQLRAIETEHLYDRAWFSITETCLAFAMFREDFSLGFVALFVVLLFLKCFHWLLEDRVDYMEQSPVLGTVFHARVTGLLSLLSLLDCLFISTAYYHTLAKGASVQIAFGFEYAILLVLIASTTIKYILHSIEIHTGDQWENKGVFMLYSDLILGFVRLTLYMMFTMVMMTIHTFPLFAIRPMFVTMRAFHKSCNDVLESRRAIRSLNTLYPDLTDAELADVADTTCIICREEMQSQQSIKRLSCQHVFHKNCLRSWFQRQQTCPICRTTVLQPPSSRTASPVNGQPAAASQPQDQAHIPANGDVPPASASSHLSNTPTPPTFNSTSFSAANIIGLEVFPQMPSGSVPMVLPPFAFPPPPLPPAHFTGMSEESIRAMTGTELTHVRARIQCLRNVRTLLDASTIQIQQYMNIVSTQSNMGNGIRLTSTLHSDLDRVLSPSENTRTADNLCNSDNKDDLGFVRRKRLDQCNDRISSSKTNANDNDTDG